MWHIDRARKAAWAWAGSKAIDAIKAEAGTTYPFLRGCSSPQKAISTYDVISDLQLSS